MPTPDELLDELSLLADGLAVPPAPVSEATRAAYAGDWRHWVSWCDLHEREPLPVSPRLVRLYVADLSTGMRPLRASTIERHVAAIAWRSRTTGGLHDLARHPDVAPVLTGIRARSTSPARKRALSPDELALLVSSMDHHTWPAGVLTARDVCVLLVAHAARLRRAGTAALTVTSTAALRLRRTDDPLLCAPCARHRWFALLDAPDRPARMRMVFAPQVHTCSSPLPWPGDGPAFPVVDRDGHVTSAPLTGSGLAQMFKRRAATAGLDASRLSFDSLRLR